jgi:hypothetical protein
MSASSASQEVTAAAITSAKSLPRSAVVPRPAARPASRPGSPYRHAGS